MLNTKFDYEYIKDSNQPDWMQQWLNLLDSRWIVKDNELVEDANAPIFRMGFTVDNITTITGHAGYTPGQLKWYTSQPDRYQLINNVYVQVDGWSEANAAGKLNAAQAARWDEIKAEREKRMNGGFKVQVQPGVYKWYHSDQPSRTQHLGLILAGASVPPIPWKTMDGTFEVLTPAIVTAIFASAFALDTALFNVAEQHEAFMMSSPDPASYDFSTGWPEKYGD
jgi:hypothetical protein